MHRPALRNVNFQNILFSLLWGTAIFGGWMPAENVPNLLAKLVHVLKLKRVHSFFVISKLFFLLRKNMCFSFRCFANILFRLLSFSFLTRWSEIYLMLFKSTWVDLKRRNHSLFVVKKDDKHECWKKNLRLTHILVAWKIFTPPIKKMIVEIFCQLRMKNRKHDFSQKCWFFHVFFYFSNFFLFFIFFVFLCFLLFIFIFFIF